MIVCMNLDATESTKQHMSECVASFRITVCSSCERSAMGWNIEQREYELTNMALDSNMIKNWKPYVLANKMLDGKLSLGGNSKELVERKQALNSGLLGNCLKSVYAPGDDDECLVLKAVLFVVVVKTPVLMLRYGNTLYLDLSE
ncbi:uncharacterized protein LTR77_011264 [Saxophila tyrrhenica]|uniref:Uncharacterized protein n=1 Tax=Saxophila tyrrhenica TaxID=1690608 RepID=A0AAV9NVP4_9PEZI|nr:hypothetical protein LTR77_011264 [Saxophila tyrrhenica]